MSSNKGKSLDFTYTPVDSHLRNQEHNISGSEKMIVAGEKDAGL